MFGSFLALPSTSLTATQRPASDRRSDTESRNGVKNGLPMRGMTASTMPLGLARPARVDAIGQVGDVAGGGGDDFAGPPRDLVRVRDRPADGRRGDAGEPRHVIDRGGAGLGGTAPSVLSFGHPSSSGRAADPIPIKILLPAASFAASSATGCIRLRQHCRQVTFGLFGVQQRLRIPRRRGCDRVQRRRRESVQGRNSNENE